MITTWWNGVQSQTQDKADCSPVTKFTRFEDPAVWAQEIGRHPATWEEESYGKSNWFQNTTTTDVLCMCHAMHLCTSWNWTVTIVTSVCSTLFKNSWHVKDRFHTFGIAKHSWFETSGVPRFPGTGAGDGIAKGVHRCTSNSHGEALDSFDVLKPITCRLLTSSLALNGSLAMILIRIHQ